MIMNFKVIFYFPTVFSVYSASQENSSHNVMKLNYPWCESMDRKLN